MSDITYEDMVKACMLVRKDICASCKTPHRLKPFRLYGPDGELFVCPQCMMDHYKKVPE
jgi:hypothetical protein